MFYENHENPDTYFDDEERKATKVYKRFTIEEAEHFFALHNLPPKTGTYKLLGLEYYIKITDS